MGRGGIPLMKPIKHCCSWLDQRFVVLGKKSNCSFVSPNNFSVVQEWAVVAAGLTQFSFRNGRGVSQKRIHQSCLTCAVPAHQGDFLSTGHACGELSNYRSIAV